ncbi:surface antigen-like protein [Thermoflavifilum aggregans]|uniref:Surface antigen-like protein n=1 Tax=Thermoflavifilum aggregans TaxID=454188 RepID=A0A2M9CSS9_9BACT|nr:surface antigen-like protein [Thermoflavifilum aggregans]
MIAVNDVICSHIALACRRFIQCFIFLPFFFPVWIYAQQAHLPIIGTTEVPDTSLPDGMVIIRHIDISGNKKTNDAIILRELAIHPGDTLPWKQAPALLEEARQRVINTSLFLSVNVYFKNWHAQQVDIGVDVVERWYIFPVPIFNLADRNFNVWWVEHHHQLSRVNYGINCFDNNLTGNNDQLIFTIQNGYTYKYALAYNLPFFDKVMHAGLGLIAGYSRNREVNYMTQANKQIYLKTEQFIYKNWYGGLNFTYRKNIRTRHLLSLTYHNLTVGDTVVALNPDYLSAGSTHQQYLGLEYRFSYTGADHWAYPLRGFNLIADLSQQGFGWLGQVHMTQLQLMMAYYMPLFPRIYLATGFRTQIQLPVHQPYFLREDMGYYENYLRGLEYNVVDASAFGILKTNLKYQIGKWNIHLPLIPEKFAHVPLAVYVKCFGDVGYGYDPYHEVSHLSNRWLFTEGVGIDFVTFYDIRLRVEYSFNQFGQNGLFLHTKSEL